VASLIFIKSLKNLFVPKMASIRIKRKAEEFNDKIGKSGEEKFLLRVLIDFKLI